MIAGIPGSGIGGLYYIALGLAMPLVELVQTCRGRSSAARWKAAWLQAGHAAGILAALAGSAWLLAAGSGWVIDSISTSSEQADQRRQALTQRMDSLSWSWIAWVSALVLAMVILLPALLAWALRLHERRRTQARSPSGRSAAKGDS
jgi:hypothetical protein